MAYITRSYFHRSYKNYKCNEVCCFVALSYTLTILFAFFVAYRTDGFWDLMKEHYEQPYLSFSSQFSLECTDASNKYFYTNIASLTSLNNYQIQPSLLSSIEDTNNDNRPESITFNIGIPYLNFTPQSCVLLIVYNFGLRQYVRLQMQAPVIFQFNSNFSQYSLNVQGNLEFQQKNAILVSEVTRNIYNNTNFLPVLSLIEVQKQLLNRNETLNSNYRTYNLNKQDQQAVSITLNFQAPIFQKILYIPPLMDSLKIAWEQFLFIYLPLQFIVTIIIHWAIKRKIFYAQVSTDLPPEQKSSSEIQ